MRILVVGTWHPDLIQQYHHQAADLGRVLATRRHTLIASPSSGIQGLVAQSYKEHGGPLYIGYYPRMDLMQIVGESVLVKPDKPVLTQQAYPLRNLLQVQASDAVIALTGRRGTLGEALAAFDFQLPFSYYEGSSPTLEAYMGIDPGFRDTVFVSRDIATLVDHVEHSRSVLSPAMQAISIRSGSADRKPY